MEYGNQSGEVGQCTRRFFSLSGRGGVCHWFCWPGLSLWELGEVAKHRWHVCVIFSIESTRPLIAWQINTKNGEPPLVVQYVKNPPFRAGDASSIPGQGTKLSCAEVQLSPPSATKTRHIQRQTKSRKIEKCLHAWNKLGNLISFFFKNGFPNNLIAN